MRNSARFIKFFLGILSPALATIISGLFIYQYSQPQVVYYSDGAYSKIDDTLIGSIFIVNEGRSSENNLSVSISEKLLPADIAVDYLSAKAEILSDGNKTRITIPKLKPREYAEIVFRSRMANENFDIENVTSESGNIEHREWVKKFWWNFTKLQLGIIWFLLACTFVSGLWVGSIKTTLLQKKVKS